MKYIIKDLAIQFGAIPKKGPVIDKYTGELDIGVTASFDTSNLDLEGFSEALVKECANFCEDVSATIIATKLKNYFEIN